jgi:hypothetical protein
MASFEFISCEFVDRFSSVFAAISLCCSVEQPALDSKLLRMRGRWWLLVVDINKKQIRQTQIQRL